MSLESAEKAGGNCAAKASGKNSKPPVIDFDDWSWLNGSRITLIGSHGKGVLDDDKDDGEYQDSTRPGLTPEFLENGGSEVGQNRGVDSSQNDAGEEDAIFIFVGDDCDCGDPENRKRKEGDASVEIEEVSIFDQPKEVAERGNSGEAGSRNFESMYPVVHDWLHSSRRIEPKNE